MPSDQHRCTAQIVMEQETNEIVHYVENADFEVSNLVNSGIYIFSVRVFTEFGMNSYPDDVDEVDVFSSEEGHTPKDH